MRDVFLQLNSDHKCGHMSYRYTVATMEFLEIYSASHCYQTLQRVYEVNLRVQSPGESSTANPP